MIKIQFWHEGDTTPQYLNNDYVYEFSRERTLFSDEFKLGCTPMAQYKLVIEKTADTLPDIVYVYSVIGNTELLTGALVVDNREDEDELTVTYTLVDYMSKFEFYYDASSLMPEDPEQGEYPTLLEILEDICGRAEVTLGTTTFNGSDKPISWYDSRLTAREYIGYIAELNGGYACMVRDELCLIPFDSSTIYDNIAVEDCENFKVGEHHVITRVLYDNEVGVYWEFGDDSGDTCYLDPNNVYITTEEDVEAIYNGLDGYEYYTLSVDNCPIGNARLGNTIEFYLGGETYKTIAQIDQTLTGEDWYGGYKLDIKSSKQAETKVVNPRLRTMAKSITTVIDREVGSITTTVESINDTLYGDGTEENPGVQGRVSSIELTAEKYTQTVTEIKTDLYGDENSESKYYTKTETNSQISQTAGSIVQTFQTNVFDPAVNGENGLGKRIEKMETWITADANGISIAKSDSRIQSRFDNDSLEFIDTNNANSVLAWVDANEGLGGEKFSIGSGSTLSQRWRIYTRENGTHLSFTKHN